MYEFTGRFDLKTLLIILVLTTLFVVLAIWMVTPAPPVGFYWDDTWYLLMAEWLSGRPGSQELVWSMLHSRQYPPLFSYAIYLSGSDLSGQSAALVMNAVFLAAGAGLAMFWFRLEGFSILAMVLASALVLFNPVALHWLPTLFSEHLFILLSILAIALANTRCERPQMWVVIGIVVGLSVATRSAGWALVAGMLAFLIVHRKISYISLFIVGLTIGLLTIPYFTAGLPVTRTNAGGIRETLENINGAYLVQQTTAIGSGWHALWGSGVGAIIAAFIVLPGLVLRLRANRPDAWYVLAYFGMLIVWPFPEHMSRFLWPLMPVFLVAGHQFLSLRWHAKIPIWAPALVMGVIFAASIPAGFGLTLDRLANSPKGEISALSRMPEWTRSKSRKTGLELLETRLQLLDDMKQITKITDAESCIYSELPAMVAVHTQRVSYASPWNSLADLDSFKHRCPYYYLIPSGLPNTDNAALEELRQRHQELFRSLAPYDPSGTQVLGAFFNLRAPVIAPE